LLKKIGIIAGVFLLNVNIYGENCASVGDVKKWGGHYYTITKHRVTWREANKIAEELGGYLAIPNSASENNFLKTLIPTPKYAWIGIYDPQYMQNYCYQKIDCLCDDSRFRTIKNKALTYKNWAVSQPDNLVMKYDIYNGKQMVAPLGEHWVAMSSIDGKWADFGNHFDKYNNPVKFYALIEFDKAPVCFTPTEDDPNIKDYKKVQCNTKIFDERTGTISNGKTYDCLKDPNGNYYCPVDLAPCGIKWDYKDGYSKKIVDRKTTSVKCPKGYGYSPKVKKCVKIEYCY